MCSGSSSNILTNGKNPGGFFLQKHHHIEYPESLVQLLDSETMDSYTAGIELSNACREFYVKRQKDAESLKSKLAANGTSVQCSSSSKSVPDGGNSGTKAERSLQSKMDILKEQLVSHNI